MKARGLRDSNLNGFMTLPSDVRLCGLDSSNDGVGVALLFECPSLSEIKQRVVLSLFDYKAHPLSKTNLKASQNICDISAIMKKLLIFYLQKQGVAV